MFLYDRVEDSTLKELSNFLLEEFKKHREFEDVAVDFCGITVRGYSSITLIIGEAVSSPVFLLVVEDQRSKQVCLSNDGQPADLTMLIR